MKLASLKTGGRDGTLVVVDRELKRAIAVPHIARTLQSAIDHWDVLAPELQAVSDRLNAGKLADEIAFDPAKAAAPLPRAYQWVDGSAYVVHVELVRKARGVELPGNFWTDPLMYQGGSDKFIGPTDDIEATSEDWGIDFEAEVCVIVDDVPMGIDAFAGEEAHQAGVAGQRRLGASAHSQRAEQGLRLPAWQAGDGILARRRDAGRIRRGLGRHARAAAAGLDL